MTGKEQDISKFLQDIFAANDEEIQCSEAGTQMIQSANADLTQEASQARYPALWQHFRVCSDCAREYDLLLALTNLEATGKLEQPAHIPPPPDEGKPALWRRAKAAVTAVFPGFTPELAAAVTRGHDPLFAPITVSVWNERLFVEFDVALHENDQQYRDLYITMTSEDEGLANLLDGIPLWLQVNDEGPAVYQEILLEADAVFRHVSPGTYTLRWQVAGQECAVTNVDLP